MESKRVENKFELKKIPWVHLGPLSQWHNTIQTEAFAQYRVEVELSTEFSTTRRWTWKLKEQTQQLLKYRKKDSKPCTMITILNSISLIKVSGIAPSALDISFSVIYFCTVVLHDAHTQPVWEKGAAQNKTMPIQCALRVFQCIMWNLLDNSDC